MGAVPFVFVDVFAAGPLAGNPLSLVTDSARLSEDDVRAISREFNQSETTFLTPGGADGADWSLRSFTPIGAEVRGAGHNALGAWIWLAESGALPLKAGTTRFHQAIGGRVLPVDVTRHGHGAIEVSMDQAPPTFGNIVRDVDELVASLGLRLGDLAEVPAQVVDTGAGHLLVRVVDRAAVDRCAPDAPRLKSLLATVGGQGCYVYSTDPVGPEDGSVAYARFFNPTVGIWEDPATGTAAGPLVASLVAAGEAADGDAHVVEQGFALGRPSRITVRVTGQRVQVSGSGIVVIEGHLSL